MKYRRGFAIICWILSFLSFLDALLTGDGHLTKQIIFLLAMGISWLFMGVIYWKKGKIKT